jgi:hypothetical protein
VHRDALFVAMAAHQSHVVGGWDLEAGMPFSRGTARSKMRFLLEAACMRAIVGYCWIWGNTGAFQMERLVVVAENSNHDSLPLLTILCYDFPLDQVIDDTLC